MPWTNRVLIALALLLPVSAHAVDPEDLLPVDQAFAVSAKAVSPDSVRVTWDIAEGYYLYRHRFSFQSDTPNVGLGEVQLPPGEPHVDEFFGRVETYRDQVSATIPIQGATPGQRIRITAGLQGCADVGVCYPPHRQQVGVSLPIAASPKPAGNIAAQLGLGQSGGEDLLPPDQAFRFEAIAMSPTELGVRFTIADDYYLYRDKFGFSLMDESGVRIAGYELPPGEPKHDPHFGDVRVFYGILEFPLRLQREDPSERTLTLVGHFQGCKENSVCYPPMERHLTVRLPATTGALLAASNAGNPPARATLARPPLERGVRGSARSISEQDRLAATLSGGNLALALLLFFGAGLLLAFTPCVFPMVPILAGILAGQGERLTTARAFSLSLVYVLTVALTYTVAGVIAGLFGQNLQALFQQPWILIAFSAVFVLLALAMFGFYELQIPTRWQTKMSQLSNTRQGGTYAGVAVMGLLSALIVGPCVAPPLAAALIVIGQQGDPVLGGAALFALSLGMGVPLLILGASAGKLLPRAGPWMDGIKRVFGVLLLALAIWMLARILPAAVTMVLWAVLFIVSGVFLGVFKGRPGDGSGWRTLRQGLGLVLLFAGALELIGASIGGGTWLQPLRGLSLGDGARRETVVFRPVDSPAQLNQALAQAAARNQPALLDFYADWCVECKRMEAYTYPADPVRAALSDVLLLKADVTDMNAGDKALLARFDLIGPPVTLFFLDGRELRGHRLIGYLGVEDFVSHIQRAFGPASQNAAQAP